MESSVSSGCGDYDFDFNGGYMTATQVMDLYIWKYNMSCLADSSGQFCLMVEDTWNVTALNSNGSAVWPTYTNKTFPDFDQNEDGTPQYDVDGNVVDNSDPAPVFQYCPYDLPLSGSDYFSEPFPEGWQGHGWPDALEYDEYPLQIQCSECFLKQYRLGIESQWGEVYDEVSDQVWNNLKRNCNITWELQPAHNLSSWNASIGQLVWTNSRACDRTVQFNSTLNSSIWYSYGINDFAADFDAATAAVYSLNPNAGISYNGVPPGNYCLPEPCQVAIVNQTMGASSFVNLFSNITQTQFTSWNKYMSFNNLHIGEVVCTGPPGGAWTPIVYSAPSNTTSGNNSTSATTPTAGTTTLPAPTSTPNGTTTTCYEWYTVQANDTCATIESRFGIELDYLRSLNTNLDAACDNLWLSYAYCVDGVPGGNATAVNTTSMSAEPTPGSSTSMLAGSTAGPVLITTTITSGRLSAGESSD